MNSALDRRGAAAVAGHRGLLHADLEFRQAVVDAAHSPRPSELDAAAPGSIARAIADVVGDHALTDDSSGPHYELVLAVDEREPDRAVTAVRAHLDGTHRAITGLVQP